MTDQVSASSHVHADASQGRLYVTGELSAAAGAELYQAVQEVLTVQRTAVAIDLSAVPRMDSLGGAWLSRVATRLRQKDMALRLEGVQGQVQEFLQLIGPTLTTLPPPPPPRAGFFEALGEAAFRVAAEAREALELVVDTVYWACLAPFAGSRWRWQSVLEELARIGVRAAFIVLLMNVLLGVVIALLSAAQLRQFGAEIYVADLVVIAFTRELAALMTGIIVTARSGSAITAELATMVVQEEIAALRSMGLNTAQFLVVPKFLAMLVAMPALTVLGMLAGSVGGMEVGVLHLGISVQAWLHEALTWVTLRDVVQGLSKSVVFGATIVFIGCHNGLRVQGGAQGVGVATTRAVVTDVVLIVVWDMLFALLFEFVLAA